MPVVPRKFDPRRKSFFGASEDEPIEVGKSNKGKKTEIIEKPKTSRRVSTTRSPVAPKVRVPFEDSPVEEKVLKNKRKSQEDEKSKEPAMKKAKSTNAVATKKSSASSSSDVNYPSAPSSLPAFDYSQPLGLSLYNFLIENLNQEILKCRAHFTGESEYFYKAIECVIGQFLLSCEDFLEIPTLQQQWKNSPENFPGTHRKNPQNIENQMKLSILEEMIRKLDQEMKMWNEFQMNIKEFLPPVDDEKKNSSASKGKSSRNSGGRRSLGGKSSAQDEEKDEEFLSASNAGRLTALLDETFKSLSVHYDLSAGKLKNIHSYVEDCEKFRLSISSKLTENSLKPFEAVGGLGDPKKLIKSLLGGNQEKQEQGK